MPMQRQTAKRSRIVDLVSGEWVQKEGMEPSYVVTPRKNQVSRARIVGTVVTKFTSEDGNFASITIDDASSTIQAKMWKEVEPISNTQVGDLVSVIGKVREYEGDIYIVPEIISKVSADTESLIRLQVLKNMKNPPTQTESNQAQDTGKAADSGESRQKIMAVIESSHDGITYTELMEKSGVSEDDLETTVNELLGEGICYEPTPGKIKKI